MINRLFHAKNPLILGVDIGAHTVKAVLLSQHGVHYKVEAFAIEPMIKGSMNEREIQDIEAVGSVISKIRKRFQKRSNLLLRLFQVRRLLQKSFLWMPR